MAVSASHPRATTPAQRDAPAIPGTNTRLTSAFQASVLIGLLLAVAAGVGLFVPGSYEADTAFAAAAFRGTDLVSLVVANQSTSGLASTPTRSKSTDHDPAGRDTAFDGIFIS